MKTKFIEAVSEMNWGKFCVGRFDDEELTRKSSHPDAPWPLLRQRGWSEKHILVFDLETCEGAAFLPGGLASADLMKHKVWVCPMFECFLEWLYKQDLTDLDALPSRVEIPPEAARKHEALSGYRRPGTQKKAKKSTTPTLKHRGL